MVIEGYYDIDYCKRQFKADLSRTDRLRFLFDPVPQGCKILDIGCGPGVDVDFLVKAGNEVHGIDILDEALSEAGARGVLPHKADLNAGHLPFPDSTFDIVIATDILEHLFLPKQILEESNRVLRPCGLLIASVPNHFFWSMRLRILFGADMILPFHREWKQWDYFHIRFFTSKGFEELLRETGYRIIERYYYRFISAPRGLPQALDRKLARRFPDLFSMHFVVKAARK